MNDNERTLFEAFLLAHDGKSPSQAIENQERRGQQDVVANQRLPRKANDFTVPRDILTKGIDKSMGIRERLAIEKQNNIVYTRRRYEEMGIIIVGDHDDLFYNVKLPDGWNIEDTDHPMWNVLLNDKHEEVATFFYKAAFYDRDAFINLPKMKGGAE